ncbi:NACHT domain-containing protein [Streptomyces sp. NPDC059753]|uniref:NACHT domain-containing protein n=1 Tax=Streptomyces sp. NPDC059753 TaxID=3346933 RepID=UPI003655598E
MFNDLIPTRRLVVLGGPGSGKSVLMMQLLQELMSRRDSGGPVPVLFSLASWNPQRQHLGDWMAAEVRRAYPGLAAPAPVPATADTVSDIADHLVETNAVWPLLDGFDELPADWHAPALDAINQALPVGQPLVLASRTLDYERALDAGIVRINGSAAVILQPLEAQAAADYLRRDAGGAHTPGPARWDQVTAMLGTPTPVGRALAAPIGLFLARSIYNPRPGTAGSSTVPDPAELCDTSRFPSRAALETHLFRAYIPAAYAPHPSHPPRWTAEQATRAFTYLAFFQERHLGGSPDLAWWELAAAPTARLPARQEQPPRLSDPQRSALVMGAVSALACELSVTVAEAVRSNSVAGKVMAPLRGLVPSLALGALLAFFTALLVVASKRHAGQRTRLRWGPAAALSTAVGLPPAALCFLAFAALGSRFPGPAIPAFFVGTGIGFTTVLGAQRIVPHPAMRIRGRRLLTGGMVAGGFGAVASFRTGDPWSALLVLLVVYVAVTSMFMLSTPVPFAGTALGPADLYRHDRSSFLSVVISMTCGLTVVIAIAHGHMTSPNALLGSLCGGLAIALSYGLGSTAWPYVTLVRSWLAMRGHVPFRLIPFLKDAHHNRGVLRRAGPVYQFRHVELQRHLGQIPSGETDDELTQPAR